MESIYDIVWARDPVSGRADDVRRGALPEELQFSVYNFEAAEVEKLWEHLRIYEAECQTLLASFSDLRKLERGKKAHDRVLHDDGPAEPEQDVAVELETFPVLSASICA